MDSIGTIVNLISNTTTKNGLNIEAEVDKKEMGMLNIEPDVFHGEWNYKIMPQQD